MTPGPGGLRTASNRRRGKAHGFGLSIGVSHSLLAVAKRSEATDIEDLPDPIHESSRMDIRMRWNRLAPVFALLLAPSSVLAQGSYKIEALNEAPPAGFSDAIKGVLNAQGYRVVDDQGKAYADFWLRKAVPASGKPGGPNGTIQFPVLAAGELLGALRFPGEGRDYRDQSIPQGLYTLRYGLQPVNGDHLGVSTYRDYTLLLPAAKDKGLSTLAKKALEEGSAESAGTSHPAVLMLLGAPESSAKAEPTMVHDDAKDTWGAVVPLSLTVKGESAPAILHVQFVLVGTAAA